MTTRRRLFLRTVTGLGVTAVLAGCTEDEADTGGGDASNAGDTTGDTESDEATDTSGEQADSDGAPDVEILSHEFYDEEYESGVRGTAVNTTDRELSYVEANARFVDADGTQIGEGLDNVTDLAADRKWEFECMYLDTDPERIDSYEIEVGAGF